MLMLVLLFFTISHLSAQQHGICAAFIYPRTKYDRLPIQTIVYMVVYLLRISHYTLRYGHRGRQKKGHWTPINPMV